MDKKETQFTAATVPADYWMDAKGALIPVKLLKPIDLARDALVGEIVTKAIELNKLMKEFKNNSFADIAAFVDLSANEYDVKLGGKKVMSRSRLMVAIKFSGLWLTVLPLMSACRQPKSLSISAWPTGLKARGQS
jgi:hypothetical protein